MSSPTLEELCKQPSDVLKIEADDEQTMCAKIHSIKLEGRNLVFRLSARWNEGQGGWQTVETWELLFPRPRRYTDAGNSWGFEVGKHKFTIFK